MTQKIALITGITGQVGSYLAEHLLNLGYIVHGIVRRHSTFSIEQIAGSAMVVDNCTIHYSDMTDMASLLRIIKNIRPTEIYNLAAQSHVKVSDDIEKYTLDVNTIGVLNILQCITILGLTNTKILQASTSEMYGNSINTTSNHTLDENSLMNPVSIYGIAKLAAYNLVKYYRNAHNIFACNSITFNHESERRGENFVTRKISEHVKNYSSSTLNKMRCSQLVLGNLDAQRDWSHTQDIVRGMVMILNWNTPDDYVMCSGESHSVREFVEKAFKEIQVHVQWKGTGLNEVGYTIDPTDGLEKILVTVDSKYYRAIDIQKLVGNSDKISSTLGWKPNISFNQLVERMVHS
jgi:GDPmannose 4,6-dehydratase